MVDKLKADGRSIEIRVNNKGDNSAPTPGNHINLDPSSLPRTPIVTKLGTIPATLERAIAHELGHAVFGTEDSGAGSLRNILRHETPIMRELGQPVRIKY